MRIDRLVIKKADKDVLKGFRESAEAICEDCRQHKPIARIHTTAGELITHRIVGEDSVTTFLTGNMGHRASCAPIYEKMAAEGLVEFERVE